MANLSFVFNYFGLSPDLFTYPHVLTNLVAPFLFFAYAIHLLLEKLGIFSSESVNDGLALVISLISVVFISSLGPWVTAIAIFTICVLELGGGKGYFVGVLLALLSLAITPYLISFLSVPR